MTPKKNNQGRPLFSIITVVFNRASDLNKTIKSVIEQSSPDYEYIIIDGGSTDGTLELIAENIKHIKISISEPDKGIYDAMNKGLSLANGTYVYFLNAGDSFCSNDILEQVSKNMSASKTPSLICGQLTTIRGTISPKESWISKALIKRTLPHQAVFIKREEHPPFNLRFKIAADFEMLLTFFNSAKETLFLNIPITNYDVVKLDKTKNEHKRYNILRCKEKTIICWTKLSGSTKILSSLFYLYQYSRFYLKLKPVKEA